jgi:hypothetical protein
MSTSLFHKDLLNQYQIVHKPGVYLLRVAYTVTMNNFIADSHPRILIPLRAVTPDGLNEIVEALDVSPTVPFLFIKNCFLTGAIFEQDMVEDDLPIKGDLVLASFKYIDENRIVCDHIEQLPREELSYVNVDELLKFNKKLKKLITMK